MANNFMSYDNAEDIFQGYSDDLKRRTDHTVVTYDQWMNMTSEERENGLYYVTGVPSADGTVEVNTMVKLWENENPTQSFAGQTVSVASGGYDLLAVQIDNSGNDMIQFVEVGHNLNVMWTWGIGSASKYRYRQFTYTSSTECAFGDCYEDNTVDNTRLIPLAVYGVHTSQTIEIKAIARDVATSADKCMLEDGTTSVQDALDELLRLSAYRPGDTIPQTTWFLAGYWSSSSNSFSIDLPLSKPILATNVDFTDKYINYVWGTTNVTITSLIDSIDFTIVENGIKIQMFMSSSYTPPTDLSCIIMFHAGIVFS